MAKTYNPTDDEMQAVGEAVMVYGGYILKHLYRIIQMNLDSNEIKEKLLEFDKELRGMNFDEIVSTYYLLHDSFEDTHEESDIRYLQIDFEDFIAYVDVNSDNTVSLYIDTVQVLDKDTMLYKPLYFEKELRQLA